MRVIFSQAQYNDVNFQAMKASQFKGIDYAVMRKFKAPIEKFNTNADFQNWAKGQFDKTINKLFGGRSQEVILERRNYLSPWKNYLEKGNDAYTPAMALLAVSAITKELKSYTDTLPPLLNQGALADSFSYVDNILKENKDTQFNFLKIYKDKLKEIFVKANCDCKSDFTGWVVIPSRENDSENFDVNVERLKILSHPTWCTKSYNAEPYLKKGDFRIYLECGEPKVGMRFVGNWLEEIQGERNNCKIPQRYYECIKNYINDCGFQVLPNLNFHLVRAAEIANKINFLRYRIGEDAIKNNDVFKIFDAIGDYEVSKVGSDKVSIKNYRQPDYDFSFCDMGIDENKLFSKIVEVRGLLTLENSNLHSLGVCEYVNTLNIVGSSLQDLGALKKVGFLRNASEGNVKFDFSHIEIEDGLVDFTTLFS